MTNLGYEEMHRCTECDKAEVCKYSAQRSELVAKIKELCDPLNSHKPVFTVAFNCNQWRSNQHIREGMICR